MAGFQLDYSYDGPNGFSTSNPCYSERQSFDFMTSLSFKLCMAVVVAIDLEQADSDTARSSLELHVVLCFSSPSPKF